MKLYYEDLIDKYNYNQLTEEEKELFFLSLEFNHQLRIEFNFYLILKYLLLDKKRDKIKQFLKKRI